MAWKKQVVSPRRGTELVQRWDGIPHCRLLIWGAIHEARLLWGGNRQRMATSDEAEPNAVRPGRMGRVRMGVVVAVCFCGLGKAFLLTGP